MRRGHKDRLYGRFGAGGSPVPRLALKRARVSYRQVHKRGEFLLSQSEQDGALLRGRTGVPAAVRDPLPEGERKPALALLMRFAKA